MKLGIISYNNTLLQGIVKQLSENFSELSIAVFAPDYGKNDEKFKNVTVSKEMSTCIKDKDIIINLITAKLSYSKKYQEISEKYGVDIMKATPLLNMIKCFDIADELDKFAEAVKSVNFEAIILNAGEPVDIITSYLNKEHNIKSYGISRKASGVLNNLLEKAHMDKMKGKAAVKMTGVLDNLYIVEITDKKGKDLYPEIREKFKDTSLNVYRDDLTRDPVRSLKFYGYFHSYDTPTDRVEDVIISTLKSFISETESEIYLNAINNDTVSGLDGDAVVEIPFNAKKKSLTVVRKELPLQCALAVTDYASAVAVSAKTLMLKSEDMFARSVKLDPYLKSKLTLSELDDLSKDILLIEDNLKAALNRRDI